MAEPSTLAVAEQAMPRLQAARQMKAALADSTPAGVPDSDRAVFDQALADLEAGRPLPADLGRRICEARRAVEEAHAGQQLRAQLQGHVAELERQAVRTDADAGLVALRPILGDCLDVARHADQVLGDADSAEAAINAGPDQADAWRTLSAAADRYAAMRGTAHHLTVTALGGLQAGWRPAEPLPGLAGRAIGLPRLLEVAGELANIDQVWPRWRDQSEPDLGDGHALVGWTINNGPPWPRRETPEYLRWAVNTPDAQLWVPTIAELQQAAAEAYRQYAQRATSTSSPREHIRAEQHLDRQIKGHLAAADVRAQTGRE